MPLTREAKLRIAAISAAIVGGAAIGLSARTGPPGVAEARAFYASQPRYLQPVPYSPTPAGLPNVRAETCGTCHRAIYAEWKVSTHARAWLDDAQFQEELKKTRKTPGRDAGWMCVNCHTPTEMQLEKLVIGLKDGDKGQPIYVPNPNFDPELQKEAITCATCHVRDGIVLGPWGNTAAPHPVRKAPELLTSEVCTQCHQASAAFPEVNLACVFETGAEVAAGPHSGKTCQSCHMPEIERPASALDTPTRTTRRHWFGGSLIPKKPEFEAEIAPLRAHYPDGLKAGWKDLPQSAPAGEELTLTLEIENAEAGHMLPTGDPERFLLIKAEVRGPDGAVLALVDERIGTTYQWEEPVTKLSDNRLKPMEKRAFPLKVTASAGPLTLWIECSKWRLSKENMDYHDLEGRTVPGRVFFSDERRLPVD